MDKKCQQSRVVYPYLIYLFGGTLVTFEEMDSSVKTIENMDEIGAAILVLFSAMTIGGIFWMGMNYWRKRIRNL